MSWKFREEIIKSVHSDHLQHLHQDHVESGKQALYVAVQYLWLQLAVSVVVAGVQT